MPRRMVIVSIGIIVFGGLALAVCALIGLDPSEYMLLIAFFGIGGGFALLNVMQRPR